MNIKEAKQQIKIAIKAYYAKDKYGNYRIPIEKQRPIFLMGPPGIGKTAIMEQIAQELGVGLVSYSMTHHTRQSALGLPFIEHKNFGGKEYAVSEYTMSEIIASMYDLMEDTGLHEGILFLDEVNCVSETLAPSMLQFLQYKVFGRHRVPDGWIVVTAGNPPEYNNSVREFDIVTWDRLKRIDIEPDYNVWKEYAYERGIHPAILTYLDIKRDDFYKIENSVDGKKFVTARGWTDLSQMICLCEEGNEPVNEVLIRQYIQNPKIANEFAVYYDLFNKYRSDYQVDHILDGSIDNKIKKRAKNAQFDERLCLLGLILDRLREHLQNICLEEDALYELLSLLKDSKPTIVYDKMNSIEVVENQNSLLMNELISCKKAFSISEDRQFVLNRVMEMFNIIKSCLIKEKPNNGENAYKIIKKEYGKMTSNFKNMVAKTSDKLSNVFHFVEEAFDEGEEMLILVTELTISTYGSRFISRYGCKEYFMHNKELLFYERQKDLIKELEGIDLEGLE